MVKGGKKFIGVLSWCSRVCRCISEVRAFKKMFISGMNIKYAVRVTRILFFGLSLL